MTYLWRWKRVSLSICGYPSKNTQVHKGQGCSDASSCRAKWFCDWFLAKLTSAVISSLWWSHLRHGYNCVRFTTRRVWFWIKKHPSSWKNWFLKRYFKGKIIFSGSFSSKCIYGVTYQLTIKFDEKYKSWLQKIEFSVLCCIFSSKTVFFIVISMWREHIFRLIGININIYCDISENNRTLL